MPVAFWLLRLAIRLLGLVSPALAGRWVYRLWFQPLRYPEPPQEQEWRRTAQPLAVVHRGQALAVDSWGTGPVVLMVHGWNGRGAQLGAFAPMLVRAGFRVVTFDTPAHGRSPGRATNLPEISEAIHAVARACGPVHAVIGHSFGVACAIYAVQHGLKVNRIVAISPPDSLRGLTRKFFTALDVAPPVQEVFNRTIETHYGADLWQRFSTEVLARQLDVPGLVIHDQNDRDVPIEEGVAVARAWPGAQFVRTIGLGHRRILRDPDVIARVAAFIAS
ncbi:alpha/beta fold hydrolase [Sulfuricaulis sp.]|uniref:alpha/beta fold hydrolase n=1 Tax=Sulfuricaulis sp. TaxID=2003553 RepID=UPI00355984AD